MPDDLPERPVLSTALVAHEFMRWYWTKDELATFAREQGLVASGNKEDLTARVSALLDSRPQPAAILRPRATKQLAAPLSAQTVIPAGQRCSQVLRAWFTERLGPGFHFDAPMREFIAASDGTSILADALDHWKNTRDASPKPIDPQFELNRFTRQWHADHPNGSRHDMMAAWKKHRSLPVDAREQHAAFTERL